MEPLRLVLRAVVLASIRVWQPEDGGQLIVTSASYTRPSREHPA
jgi:hypothetical protein